MGTPSSNIPTTSFPSHQLSSGLYVSGRPDQYKEKAPTMSSVAMPYTGGDIKKSGELGKMFDIQVEAPKAKKSGPLTASTSRAGTFSGPLSSGSAPRSALSASGPLSSAGLPRQSNKSGRVLSNSGPLSGSGSASARQGSKSGPLSKSADFTSSRASSKTSVTTLAAHTPKTSKHSGPLPSNLPATGLITSGPITSGPLSTGSSRKYSGPIDSANPGKLMTGPTANNQAVNNLSHEKEYSFRKNFPKVILWTVISLFVMGFIAGAFILAAVKNAILLIVVAALFGALVLLVVWNSFWGKRTVIGFTTGYPNSELGTAKDGQYVKVTGVVTCGSVSLESSYQKVNRCIYTSTGLFEYRGVNSLPANDKHRRFTWGLRQLESGLRALVKAGYGATVFPYVEDSIVLKLSEQPKDIPSDFLHWLTERNLSRDERTMQLSEGFIKEGSTVTVLGVVQRHDNVTMIIPPPEPVSTGCQWIKFLLPASIDGIILLGETSSTEVDVA
ncbi:hypothetical protein O6H91_02G012800 [Diphasiastrum complanatum]|uniref:Uncharacterized protein n=1 Tax=Diphasiastrum complanatum TaxID=34168 RepID=A0ACC2ECU4_DIPCM|nr:hypothetical protein O6H91_02G012800 [Diphasiastrum complanatum]